jgi:PBSX family phage terminase large subunit
MTLLQNCLSPQAYQSLNREKLRKARKRSQAQVRVLLPDGDPAKHFKQHDFIHANAHNAAAVGGIGSGKSQGGAIRAVRAAYGMVGENKIKTPNLGVVTAPTYPMLRDSSIRTFLEVAGDLIVSYNKTEKHITLKNGSEILFRSADEAETLRGMNLSWWWGDEAALCDGKLWKIMIGRLRQFGEYGYCWVTTTPRGRNWVWKTFIENNPNRERYIAQISTRDNLWLDEEFIKALESDYSGDYAKQELEGEFVAFQGLVYSEFSRERHVVAAKDIPPTFVQVVAGVDWGFNNPGVINVFGVTGDGRMYHVYEEYVRHRGIDEWADVAWQLRNNWRIDAFYCDPSEPDYIAKLQAKGCKCFQADNTVSTGIQTVKRRLAVRYDGLPGLLYYPGAVHTFAEYETYQWMAKGDVYLDVPQKHSDHSMDASRYAIMGVDKPARRSLGVKVENSIG